MTLRKRNMLVLGVGTNDADYQITRYANIEGRNRQIWMCPFYRAWKGMLARCYSARYVAINPTYLGCSVTPEWLRLSGFRAWMESQKWQGMDIDKDILFPGNKIYGPEACIFIPHELNTFLIDRIGDRGEHPLGVYWCNTHRKFRAQCSNPFTLKNEALGYFGCAQEAHLAWKRRKNEHAQRYAEMQDDSRIAEALRKRFAP